MPRNPFKKLNKINIEELSKLEHPSVCIKRSVGGIGDLLMVTPSLKAIKEALPNCWLTFATDTKQNSLIDVINNHYIDYIFVYLI